MHCEPVLVAEKDIGVIADAKNTGLGLLPHLVWAALQALEQLRSESQGDFVFPNAESPRGWFLGAVERAALRDQTWHCNRHTFASRLMMAGEDLRTVGELLGHRTAQMTKRYAHLSVNHKQSAVERISGVPIAIRTVSGNLWPPGASRK
jgi:integrase